MMNAKVIFEILSISLFSFLNKKLVKRDAFYEVVLELEVL